MLRRRCVLQHREEEDVEYREPGEGTVDVALAGPSFRVEGEVADSFETRKVPFLKSRELSLYILLMLCASVYFPLN